MKRLTILMSFFFVVSSLFSGVASAKSIQGQTNSNLGTYQVKAIDPVSVGGEQLKAYQLTYEKSKHPVTILVEEKSNCKNYIVRSKNLEIRYVCNKHGFGAKLVNAKFRIYDPKINGYYLNEKALDAQAKLSATEVTEKQALGLIASYFPELLKDEKFLM